jgi:gluconate 5-dehydrogenase/2-deoxy-D-gluconate 3-dehydrogenase
MKKNIVITGISSGIGLDLALELLKNSNIIGLSRKRPKINNPNFTFIKTDLLEKHSILKAAKKIKRIDVLINNAAITKTEIKDSYYNFDKILKVNLYAPFFLSYLLQKKLSQSTQAAIINICSINSHVGFPNNQAYSASKGGLFILTKSMANDLSKYKIRVNSISPGYFLTPMTQKSFYNKLKRKKRLSRMLINRWGSSEDLYGIVEYLISEKSSYVTGQDFIIDGGWLSKGL